MGQAFDASGQVLGEAVGETKRDVFDKLIEKHPDAAEIRVRSLGPGEIVRQGSTTTVAEAQKLTGERMLAYFQYEHLPPDLQAVSQPFAELAIHLAHSLPQNPERTVALRKLLEAKDCAVRARL